MSRHEETWARPYRLRFDCDRGVLGNPDEEESLTERPKGRTEDDENTTSRQRPVEGDRGPVSRSGTVRACTSYSLHVNKSVHV